MSEDENLENENIEEADKLESSGKAGTGELTDQQQDSLNINRAKAAYGKKTNSSGLRERRTPQRVVTSDYVQDEEYEPDDIDDETLIAPEKNVINKTYKSAVELKKQPKFTSVAESATGGDTLSLLNAEGRSGQTITFKVKGIQWKSGYSNDFSKTPLGHAMHPIPLPTPTEEQPDALKKTGIVIRPVNPKLQKVLAQLLPSAYKKEMRRERGKRERLKHVSIFYLPSTQSSSVGFIHEFLKPRTRGENAFYLYIQTSVGKAPVAILDEVLKTLEAGLPDGEKADVYDYTQIEEEDVSLPEPDFKIAEEVNEAMKQVGNTFNDSIFVHSMKKGAGNMKNVSVDFMRSFDKYLARFVRVLAAIVLILMNSPVIRVFVSMIRGSTKGVVKVIWAINKGILGISRSPTTAKIIGVISKGFSLFGGMFGAVIAGIAYFFKLIGKTFSSGYKSTASFFKNPKNFDIGISFPAKKLNFNFSDKEKEDKKLPRKKSPLKIKGARKAGIAKPKSKTISTGSAKLKQVTRPVAKKPTPPKLKGSGGGFSEGSRRKTLGGSPSQNEPVGANPLGYFEDEDF